MTHAAPHNPHDPSQDGVTLVELLVVMVIMGVIGIMVVNSFVSSSQAVTAGMTRADALEDIRPAVQRITRELRVADPLVVPSAANHRNEVGATVYRDTDGDDVPERFRHLFTVADDDGNGEWELTETVHLIADDGTETLVRENELVILVDNGGAVDPVFTYFDEDGNEIDCTPLTSAECITALADTHRIGFHVTRVVPGQNAPVAVDTAVQVRNVRFGS